MRKSMSKRLVKASFCQIRNTNPASWSKPAKPFVVVVILCTTPTKPDLFERLGWVFIESLYAPFLLLSPMGVMRNSLWDIDGARGDLSTVRC